MMHAISVRRLIAWSPYFNSASDMLAQADPEFSFHGEEKYVYKKPGPGRRLSELTKISVDMGLRVAEGHQVDHLIYSSRHGELANSAELLKMIGNHEVLSPTLFSQSVHNTAAGVYSLVQKSHVPATSLSGGKDSLMMGLISALAYLSEKPKAQVLYICADNPVPEAFAIQLKEKNLSFCVAMILAKAGDSTGREIQFSNHPLSQKFQEIENPQGVDFTRWFFSSSPQAEILGDKTLWKVTKNAAKA